VGRLGPVTGLILLEYGLPRCKPLKAKNLNRFPAENKVFCGGLRNFGQPFAFSTKWHEFAVNGSRFLTVSGTMDWPKKMI
jgi:hypothetical protein